MYSIRKRTNRLARPSYLFTAIAMALAGLSPMITLSKVHAFPVGGQAQTRSIMLSDSRPSATAVSYKVSFKAAGNYTMRGIIVDFCDSASTPIIGDATCTAPTGFTIGGVAPTVDTNTAPDNIGTGWTAAGLNNTSGNYRTLKLTNATGFAVTTGTQYTFTLSGATNTSTTGTFYARLITYTASAGDIATYAPGTEGSTDATDYGGFALSTANVITITAKVQETMTFCVSGLAPGPSCGLTGQAVTTPALTLGHGANNILDDSVVDTAQAFTQLSTNAQGGAVIRMRNTAASGGLNAGTNVIPAIGSGGGAGTTAAAAGNASFGVYVAAGSGGTGTITADTNYNSGTPTNHYAMDTTTGGGANVLGTYGDAIAAAAAPVNSVGNALTFGATASSTTPAGVYTANIILIATGTF
jgi:hypothetical protein